MALVSDFDELGRVIGRVRWRMVRKGFHNKLRHLAALVRCGGGFVARRFGHHRDGGGDGLGLAQYLKAGCASMALESARIVDGA
ncbi:unnamed protein product [Sphenostylis stenocarpa]|uniref:Uncharacterized protein n=1 Tax=Sphenostylis stenocarpa TaxID=92480 RepID=A0AA86VFN6_9FABA|nr:unnamed protein product [Sphenostylis stenocarpa]